MNWDAIGAAGEVLGAAAVVVTLIYLAVQVRLSRGASQLQSSYSTLEIYGHWRAHLISNNQLAEVVAKANHGEGLTPGEDIQLATLMDDLFLTLAISEAAASSAKALYGRSAEIDYLARLFQQNPGLAPYWDRTRDYLAIVSPAFAAAVDELRANGDQL